MRPTRSREPRECTGQLPTDSHVAVRTSTLFPPVTEPSHLCARKCVLSAGMVISYRTIAAYVDRHFMHHRFSSRGFTGNLGTPYLGCFSWWNMKNAWWVTYLGQGRLNYSSHTTTKKLSQGRNKGQWSGVLLVGLTGLQTRDRQRFDSTPGLAVLGLSGLQT
ncbi:hypothetical protein SCLCIDRAFT_1093242 [Scleroderma citrinum Foug A]|uniref:Uncharacterized protein n=1 Tax=Scleroderma citrinum Foug A TaxID=1036808 RepID=A0A0C3DQ59_9AGAM|nr:hypothetical protein SCLCIDRAFT_1093242 [Scleroderma citrinum Foug A]